MPGTTAVCLLGDAMTEQEWLACTDPQKMLEFLRGKASDRKLRLFACACCRRVWNLVTDKYSRKALTIAERYADGEVSQEKLAFAWGDARRATQVSHRGERETADSTAMWAVSLACEAEIGRVLGAASIAAMCEAYPFDSAPLPEAQREQVCLLRDVAQREQVCLLRDVVGNPFRPVPLDPAWLAWNDGAVRKMAQTIYEERAYDRLPLLADALEDPGCTNADILAHCRQPGPHVRGCWVVDVLLEKT